MPTQEKSDFINIFEYRKPDYPFQIFIGGRGTGKTYSALKGSLDKSCVFGKFIYMRRLASELELILDDEKKGEGVNPFKPINKDMGVNVGLTRINKKLAGIYNREIGEDGKITHLGEPLGYGAALSTLSGIRGVDFSDCTDWIYDEFIPETHIKKMAGESDALLNAYETINRNREMFGTPPIRLWLLANSNNIYNPIFVGLGIVAECEKMLRQGKPHRYIKERGLAIHILPPAKSFVDKKKNTALYRLTKGTRFYDMALENKFSYNDFSLIKYEPLKGWTPICQVEDCYIYKKKGEQRIHCSYQPAKCPKYKVSEKQDLIRFQQEQGLTLYPYFVKGLMTFESYELKEEILNIIS